MGQHALTHDPRDPSKKWPIWPTDPRPIDPLPALGYTWRVLILHRDNDREVFKYIFTGYSPNTHGQGHVTKFVNLEPFDFLRIC